MLREDLFDKAYESLYPVLFRIAYRITGSSTKAEDLCHEAFIKYWQREEPLPDIDQTKYWLIRVLKNISLNYEKKRSREQRAYGRLQKSTPQYSKSTDHEFFREQTRSIVQEALNNIAKHSGATEASVVLDWEPEQAKLIIEDNGRGFDPASVPAHRMGLAIMAERADEIGAELAVESSPGQGTKIAVIQPLSPKSTGDVP